MNMLAQYMKWLHTKWPAGSVERLPRVKADGSSNIPGLYIVGDLTGIPLLKFASDSGAKAIQVILGDPDFQKVRSSTPGQKMKDVVIVGAGVSGMAAALEARNNGLSFEVFEASEPFFTIVNFPKGKPIFAYPTTMTPAGELQFTAKVKEPLVEELKAQTVENGISPRIARVERVVRKDGHFEVVIPNQESLLTRRVIIGIGRSGDFRKLGVSGENRDKVYNRLHDPKDYAGQNVLVVGGGDSALEAALAIAQCGGSVTISYRKEEFSRPKLDNVERLNKLMADPMADVGIEAPTSERVTTSSGGFMGDARKPGRITLMMKSQVKNIGEKDATLVDAGGKEVTLRNDAVFAMIGREAPLEFFRRTGVKINGELGWKGWTGFGLFFLFCLFVYNWKAGGEVTKVFQQNNWFPFNVPSFVTGLGESVGVAAADKSTILGTMMSSLGEGGFFYALVYSVLIIVFGYRRIRRRKTPYVKMQTLSLTTIQLVPLFLLPYFLLPYLGNNGVFDSGIGKSLADALFPVVHYGHGREYWRAFGIILAWPLFVWNVFTSQPLWWWLGISLVQTFVILPVIVYFWGKGAYCGWICSCGAMAETLGDTHRHKMPHGAGWNRLNVVGQAILGIAFLLLVFRVLGWASPASDFGRTMNAAFYGLFQDWSLLGVQLNYKHMVDLFLAGAVGYGAYFWFSGRVWCRFACPLAALMHIYARFSRFRILANKKKCISCNVCTSVCHQGIDIMNFANKGLPMEDPECVRCSACVQSCPTGVLQFGQIHRTTGAVIRTDRLAASPVLMRES
jgi:NosR/NirI family transcriptional regulator, nitrous oxide reductase regulator